VLRWQFVGKGEDAIQYSLESTVVGRGDAALIELLRECAPVESKTDLLVVGETPPMPVKNDFPFALAERSRKALVLRIIRQRGIRIVSKYDYDGSNVKGERVQKPVVSPKPKRKPKKSSPHPWSLSN
jgi:hypothetical protein